MAQNTKRKMNKRKMNNRKMNKGGKVLASGGFGCVFSPALKCSDATQRERGYISKLMTEKHARDEYEEINSFKEILETIPNYRDYFLIYETTLCKPSKLTVMDLNGYQKKCSALKKSNITAENINDNLDKLMVLNMPNGGLPVDDYIYAGPENKIYELHECLVNLFKNGIIPMNEKNIFHCDIKDSNVLVSKNSGLKARIIDWGLSTQYSPFENRPLPRVWKNRPLQFNVPFSIILFTNTFSKKYRSFIDLGGDYEDEYKLGEFVEDYIKEWMKLRGEGHYRFINEIMFILYSNNLKGVEESEKSYIIETRYTMPYMVNYLTKILLKYTKFKEYEHVFDLNDYLDNVFIQNVDVWGFVNVYFPVLELLHNNYHMSTRNEKEAFNILKRLFTKYLYSTEDRPIDKNGLLDELDEFGRVINAKSVIQSRTEEGPTNGGNNNTRKNKTKKVNNKSYKKSAFSFTRRKKLHRFKNPIYLQ